MQAMDAASVDARLASSAQGADWSRIGDALQRVYAFADFNAAMAFVNRVAAHAESVQHHPDILIRYSKVTLTLSTHDAGGITEKDFDFIQSADALAAAARSASAPSA
ncbi:MAG: 4a-hydroxytetrahydrobiopterin dehydratase [Planctomycetota bacterium]|nr:4a-hydroxytetrahydrobiopterin dehydratase [Planctomycetota bacterium]MDA1106411.1 4a-hydroxytetrahydrobiopterin dehydratase [Planctomycetota bacterium]